MADYDWGDSCCGRFMSQHEEWCLKHPDRAFILRKEALLDFGFVWIKKASAFECRRGCGCLVFDPETHMKNVCTGDWSWNG